MPRALDYFRQDIGALDQYNSFVAPRARLDRNLESLRYNEQVDQLRTQKSISQLRALNVAPTGTGATFMNYSHYYPNGSGNNSGS